jgi:hypothetical protein
MKYIVGYLFSDSFGYHSLHPRKMAADFTLEPGKIRSEKDRRLLLNVAAFLGYFAVLGTLVGLIRIINAIVRYREEGSREYYKGQMVRAMMEVIPPFGLALIVADIIVSTSLSRFKKDLIE